MAMTAKEKREARAAGEASAVEKINEKMFENPGATVSAAGEVAKPQRSGATVTVGCKLGIAYYDIQLTKMERKFEQNMQGGREVTEGTRWGKVVRLRGTAYPRGTPPEGFPAPPLIVGGAALNPGIDKDFWDEWVEQRKLDPLVVNGMIFAFESHDHAVGHAKETAEIQSGLEPINPKKDKRMPRSTREEISDVEGGKRGAA